MYLGTLSLPISVTFVDVISSSQLVEKRCEERSIHSLGAYSSLPQTFAATLVFLVAMANNPVVQKKAQEELDRVVGPNRLPLLSDKGSLPYVDALVKEVARWKPIVPTSASESFL